MNLNRYKSSILFSCSVFFFTSVFSQSLDETVTYINEVLKTNHDRLGSTSIVGQNPTYLMSQISIDKHGKIEFRIFEVDSVTEKITKSGPPCYGYLKALNALKGNDFVSSDSLLIIYKVNLRCDSSSSCFICHDGSSKQLSFWVNNKEAANRLLNAINHLLKIAKGNSEFYYKDPFQD